MWALLGVLLVGFAEFFVATAQTRCVAEKRPWPASALSLAAVAIWFTSVRIAVSDAAMALILPYALGCALGTFVAVRLRRRPEPEPTRPRPRVRFPEPHVWDN